MDSLAHALRSFQNGALTKDALFAEVDRLLSSARSGSRQWLETLDRENTQTPLPADVHQTVLAKLQCVASQSANADYADPDASFTRLATSVFFDSSGATEIAADRLHPPDTGSLGRGAASSAGGEVIKGTGDVLNDRFVLEERIGTGGMSSVYKALDRRKLEANDRNPYVAVKVLNVEFRARPDSLIALQREAKKSQSLAHPNIVRVYDFDRDGPTVYMTMEYLAGEPLAKVLRSPKFQGMETAEAMRILEAMGSALTFAHDNRIVHADFKPGNVILTSNGHVKVIDFGIARAFQRPDETDQEATRFDPGSLGALTPTYASPEMLEHQEPDPRDDIYALACITYEMLTGRHPFGRMQATEARDGGLQLERRPKLTRRQYKALKAALSFDRQKRTPSVAQFLREIRPEPQVAVSAPLYKIVRAAAMVLVAVAALFYLMTSGVWRNLPAPASSSTTTAPSVETPPPTLAPAAEVIAPPIAAAPVAAPEPEQKIVAPALSVAAVRALLADVPCSALDATVDNGVVRLHGFAAAATGTKRIEASVRKMAGVRDVQSDVTAVSSNQCAILDVYAPYWRSNRLRAEHARIQSRNGGSLSEGQSLVVDIGTPAYQSYVNLDYFALDGNVVHMVPSRRAGNNQAPANYTATLGDLGEWRIGPPFGKEIVALLVAPRPLFDGLRAESEPAGDYLAAMKKQLERMAKEEGADKVAADFITITTHAKR